MKFEFDYQCDKEWDEMKGGDRRRFCDSCKKNVHHISHMNKAKALKFLEDRDYDVCVDFFCDEEGHTVFRQKEQRLTLQVDGLKQLVASAVAVLPLALAAAFIEFDVEEPATVAALSEPAETPLDLNTSSPIVVNTTANGAIAPVVPVVEPPVPVIEEVVEEVVVETKPDPDPPEVIRPIRHLRGKIARPRIHLADDF